MVHSRIHLVSTLSGVYKVETKNGEAAPSAPPLRFIRGSAVRGKRHFFYRIQIAHMTSLILSVRSLVLSFLRVRIPPSAPRSIMDLLEKLWP